ncbi:hypothetical protein CYY_001969 [Polysphondylium violaceum]|uniref:very-long-chain (3R)-3-hydroxyacyl-CoA dehydratase n=1 Tax=Polysphondylium violaceum TaxID=133409 RepID=A0A8J4V7C7_9MYCE|nr:hypothetical protein CYY_001969 [Polysphondylium violaceum]
MKISTLYLVFYNFVQCIGWSYILYLLSLHLITEKSPVGVWDKLGQYVILFQGAAVLEIIHSMVGLVKTPWVTTFIQVFSRVACVFLAYHVPATQNHFFLSLMLMAWSITEVIRYSFYGLSLLNACPYFIGWLRYTTFIILYPSGVAGETGTIYTSLPFVKETGLFSLSLPNSINFAFNFYYALIFSFVFYAVGLPYLYTYMLGQRKRFISGGSKKPSTASTPNKKTN